MAFTFLVFELFSQSFEEKTTSACRVRLNVTNIGTFGNAFRGYRDGTGTPSCEYPAGSGKEHLFESGIWFGGIVNGQTLVSTSAYDNTSGYSTGAQGFEYTPIANAPFQVKSSLFSSPFLAVDAVSHQDFIATYTDTNTVVPGTSLEISQHEFPMGLKVIQETYNYNFSFSDFFVIVNLKFINVGDRIIDSAYTALWANTVVRNVNVTPAGAGGSAFYNKGGNGFMDSLGIAYCYDHSGDVGFTESYVGQRFLGGQDKYGFHHFALDSSFNPQNKQWEKDNFNVHYNAWTFNNSSEPIFFLPTDDNQRYQKLTAGLNDNPCWNKSGDECGSQTLQEQLNTAGNRSDLLSVGPFRDFAPGDTIEAVFAFILAPKNEDGNPNSDNTDFHRQNLVANAEWAQTTFNGEDKNFNGILDAGEDKDNNGKITRFILPTPPNAPVTRVVAQNNQIDLYWTENAEASIDPITQELDFEGYRIYVSKLGFDVAGATPDLEFVKIAEYDLAGNGYFNETGFNSIRMESPKNFENDSNQYVYKYSIKNIQNGWQYAVAISAFDRGNEASNLESLESSPVSNEFRVYAGTPANQNLSKNEPYVYPNPYYTGAAWEGKFNFRDDSRKINFANLPSRCRIRVFSPAGDLIDEIFHDENSNGQDIKWYQIYGAEESEDNVFPGGEHSWDILSAATQDIARGVYRFSVEDLES
ncbi:MAG: hypothetical protein ACPF8V_04280, partial [Luteibaculum sp.]